MSGEEKKHRDGEGFLAAWSRRKRRVARAEAQATDADKQAAEPDTVSETDTGPEPETEPDISAEELAALPPIDEVSGATDLQPFMKPGVPETLRKAAMRKVWLSNTLICDHDDPAVDYAWDWNAPEGVPGAGGVLQGDKVSKMMGDLINRNRHEDVQKEPEDDAPDVADFAQEGGKDAVSDATPADAEPDSVSQAEPALPTDPVRRGGQPARTDARSDGGSDAGESRMERDETTPAPMAPRRHGGAIPE
ncbi:DUF3306 domain-containing protein [Rhodophyticola porphyridii]|uniref:DUF3306 domain-containing protein n=1 Tax=Rhodophyticola porphyridii TaxID=1852017 RepID=A0A3L9XY65_9RHOB|nr:DUF3306 domain-containing protein [Rhodophyticola porphyridii]RMA41561.1 DUF3306 domain-containing protein [Rhodophyticola porphyridii]